MQTDLELRRKFLHSVFGLILISILFYFDRKILIIFLSVLLLFGSIILIWRLQGNRIPIIDWFETTFERKNVRFPGYGAFWYVVGTLLLALSLDNAYEIAAAILILALGDSAALVDFGRYKSRLCIASFSIFRNYDPEHGYLQHENQYFLLDDSKGTTFIMQSYSLIIAKLRKTTI